MSTAQKINSVTAVSALQDTDLVMATSADGKFKSVSYPNLLNAKTHVESKYSSAGYHWTRVAQWENLSAACAMVFVSSGLWSGNPQGHVIAITNNCNAAPYVKQLLGSALAVRVVKKDDMLYLDVYAYCMKVRVDVHGWSVTPLAQQEPSTDGYTTLLSKTLPSETGGVICCTASQKGGVPHEYCYTSVKRHPQSLDDGRSSIEGQHRQVHLRHGRCITSRGIHDVHSNGQSTRHWEQYVWSGNHLRGQVEFGSRDVYIAQCIHPLHPRAVRNVDCVETGVAYCRDIVARKEVAA